ncbi:PDR/VanB family oxidoreductase [Actinomadura opuntiae]|uniref:PDR/VanB family oxidoreductase n=1 Tax=Actinomadura sp. OS1-43 TaxID=604315 RepID=UPI00255B317F|nr:PDR/VanB family oxidoreductase [Actinomadura sp. OS1-43]MDL4818812.1 PDR/VanB family oxidoreductase [Actinomadura sp. OS1-43]
MIPPDLRGRRERDPFWVAVNAAFNGIQRFRSLRAPAPPRVRPVDRTMRLIVLEVRPEAEDVASVRLGAVDGRALPGWQPGCHLDVLLPSGRRRQYSLCGDPADRRTYRIAVRRLPDGGGGSVEMHSLQEGASLAVQGPRNAFPFLAHDRYLFLAGGIGITPILPMVTAAERFGANWRLVYTGRTRASLPFLDELPTGRVTVRTDDEHGVPSAADLLGDVTGGTAVYCCGPAPMIDAVRAAVGPDATLHYERFAPSPIVGGKPFEVELRRSGRVLAVPADRSALDVIRDVLPDVAYSCRQGYCGTCRTGVRAGDVDDRAPSDQGDATMLTCVSRATGGRITLDL